MCRMFTGIVERTGALIERIANEGGGARMAIAAPDYPCDKGDSVCVNGVCLTVVDCNSETLIFDAVHETLRLTNLGALETGARVNLERSLAPTSRLGGHFVMGHVDGLAELIAIDERGNGRELKMRLQDPSLAKYVARKGSVALDGISLTVASITDTGFSVWIVPTTWDVTNIVDRRIGDRLNFEADVLARYAERLLNKEANDADD